MKDKNDRSLSTAEAASKLGVSSHVVRELCKYGKIPGAYQISTNGQWRIPAAALNLINLKGSKINITWWDKARYTIVANKLKSFLLLIASILTLLFATISAGADIGGAREQLIEWGAIRTFPKASNGEILIVISRFNYSDNLIDTKIEEEIKRQIESTIAEFKMNNIRVEIDQRRIRASEYDRAYELISQHNATIVIWGEDTGIRVTVNLTSNKDPSASQTIVNETDFTQIATPNQYQSFVISKLPAHISFISLFASGLALERDKYYQQAIAVIEKSVARLKDEEPVDGIVNAYFTLGVLYQQERTGSNPIELASPHPYDIPRYSSDLSDSVGFNYNLEDNKKAIVYYNLVVDLSPNGYTEYGTVYINRGDARTLTRDFEGALNDYIAFQKAIGKDENTAISAAYAQRGYERIILIEDSLGGIDDILHSKEISKTEITCADASFLSFAYIDLEKKLIAANQTPSPTDPTIMNSVFNADEALNIYDNIIALNPKDCDDYVTDLLIQQKTRAYFMRGYIHADLGYHDLALADFQNLLLINPNYEDRKTIEGLIESQKWAVESQK